MKHSLPSLLRVLAAALCVTGTASAATLFSNMAQTQDEGYALYSGGSMINASDFRTGASAMTITSVTLPLWNGDDINHTLTPSIYTDSGGLPGTLVGTLSSVTIPSSDPFTPSYANYTATSTGITLAANTNYWMTAKNSEGFDLPFYLVWGTTASNATDGGSVFSTVSATPLKLSTNNGSSWSTVSSTNNAMFSLTGSLAAAPEPSRALLAGLGLGGLMLRRRRSVPGMPDLPTCRGS
ncbi:choice-of-anchor R domain-containing protein [Prosthecobacter sp.]|uniref:choice-of-anchor R domain-containing protein n=1 Tax=Prosthecobacter sp. TaxID=1965333 RepID=UPI0037847BD1